MKDKTAFFTGHRNIQKSLYPIIEKELKKLIIKLINKNIIYYGVGGAVGFDTVSALTILSLKKYYPQIKLILVLPCKSHTKYWQYEDILLYEQIFKQANKVVYISEHYTKNCMLDRNIHLVKNSSYCISYLKHYTGGTAYTVAQAKRLGLTIYNIAKNI